MAKKNKYNRNQIRADIAKQYSIKLHSLMNENKRLREEVDDVRCQLLEAEDKLRIVEEWNERLHELISMTDEEIEILRLKTSQSRVTDAVSDNLFSTYRSMLSYVNMLL